MGCHGSILGRMEEVLFEFNLKGYLRFGRAKAGEIEVVKGIPRRSESMTKLNVLLLSYYIDLKESLYFIIWLHTYFYVNIA